MSSIKTYILSSLCAVLFIACFYPALEMIVTKWNGSDDYTHAFFVVPIICYMVWLKLDKVQSGKPNPILGIVCLSFSLIAYLVALKVQIPTLIFLTVFCCIVSVFVLLSGVQVIVDLFLPLVLLLMVIPVPNQLLGVVTSSLQLWVSDISTDLVRLLSVPIFREGNVLHVAGRSFQVVEACSGIRSLISMTTLSLIVGYFTLIRKRSMCMLFILSIPVAVLVNVVRVMSMLLAYHYFKIDLTTGTPHTIAGLVLFALGLFLLFTFQRILESWETKKTNSYLS